MILCCTLCRAVCRKHELTQFELEMASQDLLSKKQQREELATGVHYTYSRIPLLFHCLLFSCDDRFVFSKYFIWIFQIIHKQNNHN